MHVRISSLLLTALLGIGATLTLSPEARSESACAPAGEPEDPACTVKRSDAWGAYVACVQAGSSRWYAEPGLHGDPYTADLKLCRDNYKLAWGPPCTGPRFTDNADGTVTDRLSGLVWEKKTNLDNDHVSPDPHDADKTYTWSVAKDPRWSETGTAFDDFLRKLNDGDGFACSNGWRLPTFAELHTLMAPSGTGMVPEFPDAANNAPGQYWSATSSPLITGGCKDMRSCAWSVMFTPTPEMKPQAGSVSVNGKDGAHVRAVHGGL
jgi:hypothetical protein